MQDFAASCSLAVALIVVSAACNWVARLTRARALDPNGAIGLRTRQTRRSEAAWYAGHDAARPFLMAATFTGVVGAVLVLVVAFLQRDDVTGQPVGVWLGIASLAVVVLVLVVGTSAANRAADAVS
jgi:hypothetical protein